MLTKQISTQKIRASNLSGLWTPSRNTLFANEEALANFSKPILTLTAHLSEALQADFLADFIEVVKKNDPPKSDGSIPVHFIKLEVLGHKKSALVRGAKR